jgi:glycerate-2-kinase
LVVANNAKAVAAAARQAKMLGYRCEILPTESSDCPAEDVGRDLARRCWRQAISNGGGLCYMSGGEPIVRLSPADRRGKGGRNQQVALAALDELIRLGAHDAEQLRGLILLSGGTDGEDGPTDAAGALIDATTLQRLLAGSRSILDVPRSLERNDAYPLFSDLDSLLKTGPTGTNVCDLRVAIVSAERKPPSSPRGSLTFDLALPPRNHPGSPQPTTTLPG